MYSTAAECVVLRKNQLQLWRCCSSTADCCSGAALSSTMQQDMFWDDNGYPTEGFFSYNVNLQQKAVRLISQAIKLMSTRVEATTGSKFVAAEW